MATHPEPIIVGIIFAFASLIVAVTWFVAVGFVWLFLRRKLATMAQQHGELPSPDNNALLYYALSIFFWPAGFVLGAIQLKEPKTALQARNCIAIGLANLSVIVVLTCLGITIAAFLAPEWF